MTSEDYHGAVPWVWRILQTLFSYFGEEGEWDHGFFRVQLWTRAPGYKCSGSCKSGTLAHHRDLSSWPLLVQSFPPQWLCQKAFALSTLSIYYISYLSSPTSSLSFWNSPGSLREPPSLPCHRQVPLFFLRHSLLSELSHCRSKRRIPRMVEAVLAPYVPSVQDRSEHTVELC